MTELTWLRRHELDAATDKFKTAIADCRLKYRQRMNHNVLDPFSLAAIAHVFRRVTSGDVIDVAGSNAVVNCIGNALGRFHQEVLASADGWSNHDRGFDLISEERCKLAEIKNKHNTMNVANRREVIAGLENAVRQRPRGWTAYLVLIIPRNPARYEKSLNGAGNVVEMDGASFYEMVSGQSNAMHNVLDHMCEALDVNKDVANWLNALDSLPPRL